MLDKQHSSSTIKVYAAAIAASHAPIAGRSVGRDIAVTQYLRGARRMNPPRPRTVPPWDLATVLTLFVPFQSLSLRVPTLKPALLLALASVKRVGDLQALSVNPVCLEFGSLKPRLGYVPKVLPPPPSPRGSQQSLLCPVRVLRIYIERSASYRSQNSFLLALVTTLKVALLRSREFLGG